MTESLPEEIRPDEIRTVEELEALIGTPTQRVADKARDRFDDIDVAWISRSPFCLVATSAADGSCDVSPKGDPPGFVRVLDDTTLAIPERPGNRRVDGFRNMLANPQVGLIFLVPGRTDTLRVNGRVRLVRDAPYFDDMVVKGHRPLLAAEVGVDQVFYHCAKAFLRSRLWEHGGRVDDLPSRARIVQALERPSDRVEDIERHYGPGYAATLYRA